MWKVLKDSPDLSGATIYEEAERVIVGGRWHVLPDGAVYHEHDGQVYASVLSAASFTTGFREVATG